MLMAEITDVLIIGAGPAGLAAAIQLQEHDVDFILVAREAFACENKTCGGFVPARASREFDIEEPLNSNEITSARLKFPGLDIMKVDFGRPVGFNATRKALGDRMVEQLQNRSACTQMKTLVTSVSESKDSVDVSIRRGSQREILHAKILIDASGANPISVKSGLVRKRISNMKMGYGVQYHLRTKGIENEFPNANDFFYGHEFSPGGYAWIFPRGEEVVLGTGGLVARVKESDKRPTDYLDHLLQDIEPTRSDLKDAKLIKTDAAVMPLAGIVTPSYSRRIMLVGDAAGHCSPITGEGIYYSMIGGKVAARAAKRVLVKGDARTDLAAYERDWRRAIGSDLKWGAWLQKRLTIQGSSSFSSSLLRSEKSQRLIAEMLVGERSVISTITKIAPAYLRSKVGI
jgi:digeranylgeranylglycerophospholipid reductase